ncbi:MAG: F0F1 ATP synthase subunit alpha, partial [Lachnospiraceae bacterium]|nr:F0F1 ATP synthase subunit alpha [Lachnospiraceae bacterium]
MNEKKTAVLYSSEQPAESDLARLADFLLEKYKEPISIGWKKDPDVTCGFRLVVGSDVYDWNKQGRLRQLQDALLALTGDGGDIIPLIKDTLTNWTPTVMVNEIGTVTTVGDGIATVSGLDDVTYGEILLFSGGVRGMALDLRRNETACILFDPEEEVCEGSTVKRTGKVAGVPVGEGFCGRVVDPLGVPIDGLDEIIADDYRPVENEAPAVIDRQPVNVPLETGILAIDSMFPIGRGQRELIIGDRQTGKSTIILDTIINQKDKDVICIYVAIGQKTSTVARLVDTLKNHGAMDYTIVVNASAAESAPLQYIAP